MYSLEEVKSGQCSLTITVVDTDDDVREYIESDIEDFLSKCDPLETNNYEVDLRILLDRGAERGY